MNLSQADVAKSLGTTVRSISRWELGERTPSSYFRTLLCVLYQKRADELDLGRIAEGKERLSDPLIAHRPELTGREQDMKQIKQALFHEETVAIHGLPGVGKSALAIALTYEHEVRHTFSDGILWAGLGPAPNIHALLTRWGKLLHSPWDEGEEHPSMTYHLRQHIGDSRLLIILDDVWSLDDAFALMVGGPNCVYLLTTRSPTIAMRFASHVVLVQELTESEGLDLLQRLAPFVLSHELQRVSELVKAVGGLPLALTILGNFLRVQSHSNQLRRVRDALDCLTHPEKRLLLAELQTPSEPYTSLPATSTLSLSSVISASVQRLTERARTTLSALALFDSKPQHFSEAAAIYVASCTTREIDELTDTGLLLTSEEGYTIHPVIADYARASLQDPHVHTRFQVYRQNGVP